MVVFRFLLTTLLGLFLALGAASAAPTEVEEEVENTVPALSSERGVRGEPSRRVAPIHREHIPTVPTFPESPAGKPAVHPVSPVRLHVLNCCWRE